MKKLLPALAAAGFGLLLAPHAIADEAKNICGVSYMMLPSGGCLNLTYMGILGSSRAELSEINQAYQEQFNANVSLELNQFYILTETAEQREARYTNLAETSLIRNDVEDSNQTIEGILSPVHVRAMGIVYDSFYPYGHIPLE